MKRIFLPLLAALTLAAGGPAQADPTVIRARDFADRLKGLAKVAILPVDHCPAALDCAQVERMLFVLLQPHLSGRLIHASVVRQKLFEAGLEATEPEEVAKLLGADAVAVLRIPHADFRELPQGQAPEARVELSLVTFDQSAPLFRGTNQGQGTIFGTAEGFAERLLREVVKRAFR